MKFYEKVEASLNINAFVNFQNVVAKFIIFDVLILLSTMANLPTEKVNELKQLIHSHLNQTDVHSKIKSCLDDSFGAEADARSGAVDENAILNILRERGVINDVMRTLKFEGVGSREGGGERERLIDHSAQKTNDDTSHAKGQ